MPSKLCPVCNNVFEIPTKDWKLVDHLGDVVCSRECVLAYIKTPRSLPDHLSGVQRVYNNDPDAAWSRELRRFFRSQYEVFFAEWLAKLKIQFDYEAFAFPVANGFYIPDFHLPQHQLFIEIKGAWGPSSKSKYRAFTRQYPDVDLLVVPWTIRAQFYKGGRWGGIR